MHGTVPEYSTVLVPLHRPMPIGPQMRGSAARHGNTRATASGRKKSGKGDRVSRGLILEGSVCLS